MTLTVIARLLSALVLIPLALGALWFNPAGVTVFALVAVVVGGMMWEYARLANAKGASIGGVEIVVIWLIALLWMAPSGLWRVWLYASWLTIPGETAYPFVLIVAFARPVLRGKIDGALMHAAGVVFAAFLLGWCFGLHSIRVYEQFGVRWVFILLASIWACDSGAYFVGRAVGKHPLAPKVSPKKTWEGSVGGFVFAIVAAYLVAWWLIPSSRNVALGVAVIAGVFGQFSDLAESTWKRDADIKDSGGLIPGHGGLLDRMDSLLLTMPMLYYYLTYVKYAQIV